MAAKTTLALTLLSAAVPAMASASLFAKRDSWGPAFSLGPAQYTIIQTTTTIYPGKMPSGQEGGLFSWLGISNGTGDLIQSIVGSYPKGESECSGANADTTWCISSEVYGDDASGSPYQWVGSLTTADVNYENGILLNYTLIDKSTYLWLQTMSDAVTGDLLSTFNKTSGTMLGWGTALECNTYSGHACTGTSDYQYYVNSTIILEEADESFKDTLGTSEGVKYTDMTTSDGGKTWTISKITIPPMVTSDDSTSSSAAASEAAATSTPVVAASSGAATYVPPMSSYVPTTMATVVQSTPASSGVAPATQSTGGFDGWQGGFPGQQSGAAGASGAQPTGQQGGFGGQQSAAAGPSGVPSGAQSGGFPTAQASGAPAPSGTAGSGSESSSYSGSWGRHRQGHGSSHWFRV